MDLDSNTCEYKKISGCGAGCEYVAITPKGDIYPCHQFVGNDSFILGNVDEGIVEDEIEHGDFQLSLRKIQFDGITTENGEDDIMPAYTGNIYHDIYTEEQLPEKQYDMVWLMNRYDGGNAEQICREISVVEPRGPPLVMM